LFIYIYLILHFDFKAMQKINIIMTPFYFLYLPLIVRVFGVVIVFGETNEQIGRLCKFALVPFGQFVFYL
jgi:hypothetical protein